MIDELGITGIIDKLETRDHLLPHTAVIMGNVPEWFRIQ